MVSSEEKLYALLEKLSKWRTFFASWQLGTRLPGDGELRAIKDHREATILLRVELSALTTLLTRKEVFTASEFQEALIAEAKRLDHDYEERFPGWRSTSEGMHMKMPEAVETAKNLGFPA